MSNLSDSQGTFWIEHNGLKLHIRFPEDGDPANNFTEITTKEQIFAPKHTGLGYIRIKGITFEHAANGNPVPQRGLVSTGRGHHWIIEDCIIQWANSVGLDVGNECWNAMPPGEDFSNHIIRRNIVRQCGVCGLAAYLSKNLLVEDNLFEDIGWQRAYHGWESGGVKVHFAENMMFRRNIVRHIEQCAGLWLDVSIKNCRITSNVFTDMPESYHCIQFEGTRFSNMVDNNIIWGIGKNSNKRSIIASDGTGWDTIDQTAQGCGIYSQGSDYLIIINNLIGECGDSGFYADTIPYRLVDGRGGTAREIKIYNNIFYKCGNAAINFDNEHNYADGNLYISMNPDGGYLRILNPGPGKWLDLEAWRRFYGWDLNGYIVDGNIELDSNMLILTGSLKNKVHRVLCMEHIETDYYGEETEQERYAGPIEWINEILYEKFG